MFHHNYKSSNPETQTPTHSSDNKPSTSQYYFTSSNKQHYTMISFTKTTLLSLAVLLLLQVFSVEARTPCHICGAAGNQAMKFPNVVLSNVGRTCTDISMEVAVDVNIAPGSQKCTAKQNQWKGRCCSGTRPAGSNRPTGLPAQNIPSTSYVGPHPVCNLCRDGDYPFATSMVINFLYIGEGSCAQYYKYGREGRIQAHMCDPVKYFAYEPCGCGNNNPYFNKNHPLNQQAQQAPSTNNGSSNNNNNNNNKPQQQRVPQYTDNKDSLSLRGNGYGGSATGGGNRKRALKGSAPVAEEGAVAVIDV